MSMENLPSAVCSVYDRFQLQTTITLPFGVCYWPHQCPSTGAYSSLIIKVVLARGIYFVLSLHSSHSQVLMIQLYETALPIKRALCSKRSLTEPFSVICLSIRPPPPPTEPILPLPLCRSLKNDSQVTVADSSITVYVLVTSARLSWSRSKTSWPWPFHSAFSQACCHESSHNPSHHDCGKGSIGFLLCSVATALPWQPSQPFPLGIFRITGRGLHS